MPETQPLTADPSRPAFLPEDSDLTPRTQRRRGPVAVAWQVPVFGVALAALGVALFTVFPRGRTSRSPQDLLTDMRTCLIQRQYTDAALLSRTFLRTYEAPSAERALACFYQGRALREGALAAGATALQPYEAAIVQFDTAVALPSCPPTERQQALLWAGDCLERLSRPGDAGTRYLNGLSTPGEGANALRLALLRLWSRADRPNADAAAEQADFVLADPKATAAEKAESVSTAGRAAVLADRPDEAAPRFKRIITEFSNTAFVAPAHLALARIAYRGGRFDEALSESRLYLGATTGSADPQPLTPDPRDVDAAAFILADGLLETGQAAEACLAFEQVAQDFPGTWEGQAAGLKAAAGLIRQDRGDDALARMKAALKGATPETWAGNPWLAPADLAALVQDLRRYFFTRNQYEKAVDLAIAAKLMMSRDQYLETLATAYRLMAEQESREAAAATGAERDRRHETARRAWCSAGDAESALADVTRTQPTFTEHLWSAIECYRAAEAHDRAIGTLEAYMRNAFTETAPQGQRYIEANYYLAESSAAVGRTQAALDLFKRIVQEAPRHAYAYQARLAWGECCLARGLLDEADTVLTSIVDNTDGDLFSPRSVIWRKAIFLLGETLERRGAYDAAIRRLTEAIERYADEPEAQRGRYVLAECHREAAMALDTPVGALVTTDTPQDRQAQRHDHLRQAVACYTDLLDRYSAQEKAGQSLDALDETQRANSCFFIGDCQFDLGAYDEAAATYERAADRYQTDSRSVPALMRVAEAARRQGRADVARLAVAKARSLLKDASRVDLAQRPTGMTREQWLAWLDWAEKMQ